jgi:hypothetical protein
MRESGKLSDGGNASASLFPGTLMATSPALHPIPFILKFIPTAFTPSSPLFCTLNTLCILTSTPQLCSCGIPVVFHSLSELQCIVYRGYRCVRPGSITGTAILYFFTPIASSNRARCTIHLNSDQLQYNVVKPMQSHMYVNAEWKRMRNWMFVASLNVVGSSIPTFQRMMRDDH